MEKVSHPFTKTAKQAVLSDLRNDYINVRIIQDTPIDPTLRKAYQIIETILDYQLRRLER